MKTVPSLIRRCAGLGLIGALALTIALKPDIAAAGGYHGSSHGHYRSHGIARHFGRHHSHAHRRHIHRHDHHRGQGYRHRFRSYHHHRRYSHYRPRGYARYRYSYHTPYRRYDGYPPYRTYRFGHTDGHRYSGDLRYIRPGAGYSTAFNAPAVDDIDAIDIESTEDDRALSGPGWPLLEQGRATEALRLFAYQAQNNPAKGGPKVGYALAAAAAGNLSRGIWAMRRALRIDPAALHYLAPTEPMRQRIGRLIQRYQTPAPSSIDDAFMLASLLYLNGDDAAARDALTAAIDGGDHSDSAAHLLALIDTERTGPDDEPD